MATFTTAAVFVGKLDAFSVSFATPAGSTLVGTLTLQVSNDPGNGVAKDGQGNSSLLNWQPLNFWDVGAGAQAASKAVASGAQTLILAEQHCTYRWMRLVFTFTSGSGVPTIAFQQKAFE